MKVWVVERHVDYESSEFVAVFNGSLSIEDIKSRFPNVQWDKMSPYQLDNGVCYEADNYQSSWSYDDSPLLPFNEYGFDRLAFTLVVVQE